MYLQPPMLNQQNNAANIAKLDIIGTYFPFYISSHVHRATAVHKFYTKKYNEFVDHYNKIPKQNIRYLVFIDLLHYMPGILSNNNPILPANIITEFDIFFDLYILNKLIYDNIHLFVNPTYSPHAATKEIAPRKPATRYQNQIQNVIGKSTPINNLPATLTAANQRVEQVLAKISQEQYNAFAILYVAALFDVNLITGEVPQYDTCTNLYFMRLHLLAQCMFYNNHVLYPYIVNAIFAYNITDGIHVIDINYYFIQQYRLYNLLMINYVANETTNRDKKQVNNFMVSIINKINPNIYQYDVSLFISTIVIFKTRLYTVYYNALEYYMAKTNDINTSVGEQIQDESDMFGYNISTRAAKYFDEVYPNYVVDNKSAAFSVSPLCTNIQEIFPYIINAHIKAQMFVGYLYSIITAATPVCNLSHISCKIPTDIQEDILLMITPELVLELINVWPAFIYSNFVLLLIGLLYRSYNIYNANIQPDSLYLDRTDIKKDPTATIAFAKLDAHLIKNATLHNELFGAFSKLIEFLIETRPRVYDRQFIMNTIKANFNYLVAIKYFNYIIDNYIN